MMSGGISVTNTRLNQYMSSLHTEDDTFRALNKEPYVDVYKVWIVERFNDRNKYNEFFQKFNWTRKEFLNYEPTVAENDIIEKINKDRFR